MKKSENTMLQDRSIHRGNLVLVNSEYPVVVPCERKYISVAGNHVCGSGGKVMLAQKVASVLAYVFRCIGCGDDIVAVSGYRSRAEQEQIYEESLRENGVSFTRQYVALPDHSEHQTGLAIDLGLKKNEIDFICPDFPYEGICQDFRRNAAKFGFIERYKREKEKITGISHEPWHFRYVGYPHSEIMEQRQMSLEEYIEYVKAFPYEGGCVSGKSTAKGKKGLASDKHLKVDMHGQGFEIFYVKEGMAKEVRLPEQSVYEVSGNNIDGFIITVWRNFI